MDTDILRLVKYIIDISTEYKLNHLTYYINLTDCEVLIYGNKDNFNAVKLLANIECVTGATISLEYDAEQKKVFARIF